MGGAILGALLETAGANAEDARNEHSRCDARGEGVRGAEGDRGLERWDRRLLAISVASRREAEDQGGNRGKGSAQAVHGPSGTPRASTHPERRGAQEAAAGQSVLGRGVP